MSLAGSRKASLPHGNRLLIFRPSGGRQHHCRGSPGQRAITLEIIQRAALQPDIPLQYPPPFRIFLIGKPADPLWQSAQWQDQLGAGRLARNRGFGGSRCRRQPEGGQQAEQYISHGVDPVSLRGALDGATSPGVYLTDNHTACWHCGTNMVACLRLRAGSRCHPQTSGKFVTS